MRVEHFAETKADLYAKEAAPNLDPEAAKPTAKPTSSSHPAKAPNASGSAGGVAARPIWSGVKIRLSITASPILLWAGTCRAPNTGAATSKPPTRASTSPNTAT